MTDQQFEPLKDLVLQVEINTTAAKEHVGPIERWIQVVKEKNKSLRQCVSVQKHASYGTDTYCVQHDILDERFSKSVWESVIFSKGHDYGVD